MPDARVCDNCGKYAGFACVTCNRPLCDGCRHCGGPGYQCGLCLDRASEPEEEAELSEAAFGFPAGYDLREQAERERESAQKDYEGEKYARWLNRWA